MISGPTWATLSGVGLLLACSAEPPVAASRQPIVEGVESGPEQDGVLLIRALLGDEKKELLCSASLVAPNLLLTAQHCVSYNTGGLFSCNTRGELGDNPDGGGELGLSLPPEMLEVYDGTRPRRAPLAHGARIVSPPPTN